MKTKKTQFPLERVDKYTWKIPKGYKPGQNRPHKTHWKVHKNIRPHATERIFHSQALPKTTSPESIGGVSMPELPDVEMQRRYLA